MSGLYFQTFPFTTSVITYTVRRATYVSVRFPEIYLIHSSGPQVYLPTPPGSSEQLLMAAPSSIFSEAYDRSSLQLAAASQTSRAHGKNSTFPILNCNRLIILRQWAINRVRSWVSPTVAKSTEPAVPL